MGTLDRSDTSIARLGRPRHERRAATASSLPPPGVDAHVPGPVLPIRPLDRVQQGDGCSLPAGDEHEAATRRPLEDEKAIERPGSARENRRAANRPSPCSRSSAWTESIPRLVSAIIRGHSFVGRHRWREEEWRRAFTSPEFGAGLRARRAVRSPTVRARLKGRSTVVPQAASDESEDAVPTHLVGTGRGSPEPGTSKRRQFVWIDRPGSDWLTPLDCA